MKVSSTSDGRIFQPLNYTVVEDRGRWTGRWAQLKANVIRMLTHQTLFLSRVLEQNKKSKEGVCKEGTLKVI